MISYTPVNNNGTTYYYPTIDSFFVRMIHLLCSMMETQYIQPYIEPYNMNNEQYQHQTNEIPEYEMNKSDVNSVNQENNKHMNENQNNDTYDKCNDKNEWIKPTKTVPSPITNNDETKTQNWYEILQDKDEDTQDITIMTTNDKQDMEKKQQDNYKRNELSEEIIIQNECENKIKETIMVNLHKDIANIKQQNKDSLN